MTLGPQLWVGGARPSPDEWAPLVDDGGWKPRGGLWTSTLVGGWSDWMRWCRGERFYHWRARKGWVLTPDPEARVYEIDSEPAMLELFERFPGPPRLRPMIGRLDDRIGLDRFAAEYDALHLTESAMWNLRLNSMFVYGWDCESTWWTRWRFAGEPERVDLVRPD